MTLGRSRGATATLCLVWLAAWQLQAQVPNSRKPTYPKLESQLSDLVKRAVTSPDEADDLAADAPLSENGAVAVAIHLSTTAADPQAAVLAYLADQQIVPSNVAETLIEAYVPLLALPDLADGDTVARVRLIRPPIPHRGESTPGPVTFRHSSTSMPSPSSTVRSSGAGTPFVTQASTRSSASCTART